jgi:hypothetical protein
MTDFRVVDLDDPGLQSRLKDVIWDCWADWWMEAESDAGIQADYHNVDAVLAVLRDTSHPANPDDVWTGLRQLREPR